MTEIKGNIANYKSTFEKIKRLNILNKDLIMKRCPFNEAFHLIITEERSQR